MIQVPEDCEPRDVAKWLSQVFLHGDAKTPYVYAGYEGGRVHAAKLSDPHRRMEQLNPQDCYAHWPLLGCFNLREDARSAVYISRNTVRQWNRSLTGDLLSVKRLDSLVGRDWMRGPEYVHVPYDHRPYIETDAAIRMVREGIADSVALSRRVAVGAGLCTYKLGVFVDGELSGTLCEREISLFPDTPMGIVTKTFGERYEVSQRES